MIDKRPLMIARIVPALLMATQVAAAQAAPPPDASGQFREMVQEPDGPWFT